MANDHNDHSHDAPTFGADARAAFLGLIIGAIVLFGIVRTIIYLTNAKYARERPAAEATR
jgi:hypothetical protein